jgi:hypothetical protein
MKIKNPSNMKKLTLSLIIGLILTPSIALASWYNPFTWKIFFWIYTPEIETVSTSTPEQTVQPEPKMVVIIKEEPKEETELAMPVLEEVSQVRLISNEELLNSLKTEAQKAISKYEQIKQPTTMNLNTNSQPNTTQQSEPSYIASGSAPTDTAFISTGKIWLRNCLADNGFKDWGKFQNVYITIPDTKLCFVVLDDKGIPLSGMNISVRDNKTEDVFKGQGVVYESGQRVFNDENKPFIPNGTHTPTYMVLLPYKEIGEKSLTITASDSSRVITETTTISIVDKRLDEYNRDFNTLDSEVRNYCSSDSAQCQESMKKLLNLVGVEIDIGLKQSDLRSSQAQKVDDLIKGFEGTVDTSTLKEIKDKLNN